MIAPWLMSLQMLPVMLGVGIYPPAEYGDQAFRAGVDVRHDASRARPYFRTAAQRFDEAWKLQPLDRTAGLALCRGRAHFLAGNPDRAIAAFHAGLSLAPADRELQQALQIAREAVNIPRGSMLEREAPPTPLNGWRHRISPWDLYLFAGVCAAVLIVGLASRYTTRPRWAILATLIGAAGWTAVALMGWQIERETQQAREFPIVIIAVEGTSLRAGNTPAYPLRISDPLPRGLEMRFRTERGGWCQVQLSGGAIGWVPTSSLVGFYDEPEPIPEASTRVDAAP